MDWPICVAVVGTAAFSFLLTGCARWFAPMAGLVDVPDGGRKAHRKPMPLMGGAAMYGSLLVAVGLYLIAGDGWVDVRSSTGVGLPMLLLSGGLFCVLGLVDDKWGMRARNKFLWQIVACLPFAIWGRSVESVEFVSINMQLGLWGVVFTVVWLVACSNIINLVDGLDGLAGTISLVMAIGIAALAALSQRYGIAAFALMFAGSILGFLIHNWPPAKIFMGDSGSLTLGFLIGALSIEASTKKAAGFMLIVPLVLISIPVYDTLMAILRRKLTGKSIAHADRGHIHHRLQDRGLSRVQCLLTLGALCVVMAVIALVSAYSQSDILAVSLCIAVLVLLTAGRVFGHDEAGLLFRHINALNTLVVENLRAWPSRMLAARMPVLADRFQGDIWEKLCRRVEKWGGASIEFVCINPSNGRVIDRLSWTYGNESAEEPLLTPAFSKTASEPKSADSVLDEDSSINFWQFRYSIQRNDRLQTTIVAEGHVKEGLRAQRLDDLFRSFETFCRHWPIEESLSERAIGGDITPVPETLPIPQPLNVHDGKELQPSEERRAA